MKSAVGQYPLIVIPKRTREEPTWLNRLVCNLTWRTKAIRRAGPSGVPFGMTLRCALVFLCVLRVSVVQSSDQIPAPPQSKPIAIVGGDIFPIDGPPIPSGTVVFDKGKIVAVGKMLCPRPK